MRLYRTIKKEYSLDLENGDTVFVRNDALFAEYFEKAVAKQLPDLEYDLVPDDFFTYYVPIVIDDGHFWLYLGLERMPDELVIDDFITEYDPVLYDESGIPCAWYFFDEELESTIIEI